MKWINAFLSLFLVFSLNAQNGLIYNVIDEINLKVSVEVEDPSSLDMSVFVPATVDIDGSTYQVSMVPEGAFANCTNLTDLFLPNTIEYIAPGALFGCSNLTYISLPFPGTSNNDFYVEPSDETCFGIIFGTTPYNGSYGYSSVLFNTAGIVKGESSTFYLPETLSNVVISGGNITTSSFGELPAQIRTLTFTQGAILGPKCLYYTNVETINIEQGCSFLPTQHPTLTQSEKYGSLNFYISDFLDWCQNGYEVSYSISKWRDIHLYHNFELVKDIEIPEGITQIQHLAFSSNDDITSVKFPTTMEKIHGFGGCSNLTSVDIPNTAKYIGDYAFSGCGHLVSINLPTSVTTIGEGSFESCSNLTHIDLPNSIVSIGKNAFSHSGLTQVTIPDSISTLKYGVFSHCFELQSITLPKSISSIEGNVFENCKRLEEIICLAENVPQINENVQSMFFNVDLSNVRLYVPGHSIESYKENDVWNRIGSILPIEGTTPTNGQCATPKIIVSDGAIHFSCDTEGAKYHYEISSIEGIKNGISEDGQVSLKQSIQIAVYATASGYYKSEVAAITLPISIGLSGDINGNGELSVEDVVRLVEKIIGK